jgi:phenylacetate-CoA ligase
MVFNQLHFEQLKNINDLRKSQWKDFPSLQKIQTRKLKRILKHAYENVNYYHQLFKSLNLRPGDIQTSTDLTKLPILKKIEIQKKTKSFHAKNVQTKKCSTHKTSGSTGIPLTITLDSVAYYRKKSRYFRSYFSCGLKPWNKIYQFCAPDHFNGKKCWYNRLGLLDRQYFSVFDSPNITLNNLIRSPPNVIEGYPSYLVLLAQKLKKFGKNSIHPKLTFTSAELLTDYVRKKIESEFKTEVFDRYGSVEFGVFGWECIKHEGYHLDVEDFVVEFLRDGEPVAPGEKGEVVVTDLSNFAMPLIRYSLGDIATPTDEKCSCGRGLPLMKIIDGRADDFLLMPSGEQISPRKVGLLEYVNGVNRFKIIQEKRNQIVVQVEPAKNFSERTIFQIREIILRGCLGEHIEVTVENVNKIPRDKSGKIRMVMSKVD